MGAAFKNAVAQNNSRRVFIGIGSDNSISR
jgi:hypothetical protein